MDSTNTPEQYDSGEGLQRLSKTAGSRKKVGIRKSQISGPLELMDSPEVSVSHAPNTALHAAHCTTCCTLHYMLYTVLHAVHCTTCCTLHYMLYTALHATHCTTCYTLHYILRTALHTAHCTTCYALHYMLHTALHTALHSSSGHSWTQDHQALHTDELGPPEETGS